jgi:hypothetical protein
MVIYSLTLICALLHTVASGSFRVNGAQINSKTKSSIFLFNLLAPEFYKEILAHSVDKNVNNT